MTNTKRHLLARGNQRAACGLNNPKHWTSNPAEVSCLGCRRTLAMADAEVRLVTKQTK